MQPSEGEVVLDGKRVVKVVVRSTSHHQLGIALDVTERKRAEQSLDRWDFIGLFVAVEMRQHQSRVGSEGGEARQIGEEDADVPGSRERLVEVERAEALLVPFASRTGFRIVSF